jgi:hypothetical protein
MLAYIHSLFYEPPEQVNLQAGNDSSKRDASKNIGESLGKFCLNAVALSVSFCKQRPWQARILKSAILIPGEA